VLDVAIITLVVAALLLLIAASQPVAVRFHIPATVLLAGLGVGLGSLAAFLLATPLTDAFNELVAPIVNLPIRSSVFLYVLLPLLLFQASITLQFQRIVDDIAPILLLAVVAVVLAAAAIGYSLNLIFGVSLVAALLLGAIVATTDPGAVVTIFRSIDAPARLTRLVEGESLLNDAAAIALFSLLLAVSRSGEPIDFTEGLRRFAFAFSGGALAGFAGGRAVCLLMPLMRGIRAAEVTLTIAAAYIVYIVSDKFLASSGVVAVVVAGLTVGASLPGRIMASNWRYLTNVWDQIAFWAGSLVFILAAILVPRIFADVTLRDGLMVLTVIAAALLARAAVLFLLLPLLTITRLMAKVSLPYSLTILWGGLRGAVTLALALAVTENVYLDPELKRFVAAIATGFVLFTLFVNGLTLRPVIRWLKLDRLSPIDVAVRNQVVALALADVADEVRATAKRYDIEPKISRDVVRGYEGRIAEAAHGDIEELLSDRERLTLGLIALATREKILILEHQGRHTIALNAVIDLLRHAERLIESVRSDGRTGYNRAARQTLDYGPGFRIAYFAHQYLGVERLLGRRIARRFEALLMLNLLLSEILGYIPRRITPVLGPRIGEILTEIVRGRQSATRTSLETLRLQYPEYAETLEKDFLIQIGEQHELANYDDLLSEGLVGEEMHESLRRAVLLRGPIEPRTVRLNLKLDTVDLVRSLPIFAGLDDAQIKRLRHYLKARLVMPGTYIIRKDDGRFGLHFIASGAVEVHRPDHVIRLGPGNFVGEMSLLTGLPKSSDVVALSFCHLLTLSKDDFLKFLAEYPKVRAEIEQTAMSRAEDNRMSLLR
jgi:CPA1 family monovalent cation:H+ antiporter